MSFVFIGYFGTFDVYSEPGTVVDTIRAHHDQVGVLFYKAALALVTAIDPIECDQSRLKQDNEFIIFKAPLIQYIS